MSVKSQKKKSVSSVNSKNKWLPIIILVIGTFLYYGNTLKNGYSLDDDLVTSTDNNPHELVEKGISGIPEIFSTHYVDNSKQRYEYRPLVTASFAIEYAFNGGESHAGRATFSHFMNVALYAILIVLIYLLVKKLLPGKDWKVPFFTALLFLIHPIHSEVVNNIKSRDELFVMLFGLLTALSLLKHIDEDYKKSKWLFVAFGLMVLAFLSKITGIVYIVAVPIVLYYFRNISIKKLSVFFGILVLAMLFVMGLKEVVLPEAQMREFMFFENPLTYSDSFMDRIPMFFYSMFFYFKMMIYPYPLVYYYGYDQIPIADWSYVEVWIGLLLVVGASVLAFIRIKKKEMWAFGALFFMFGIGGAANLIFPMVGIVGERFVFSASFGLLFLLAFYGVKWYEKNKKTSIIYGLYAVIGVVVLLSFMQVTTRNKDWESRFSLYGNDIANLSKSVKAHSLLGTELTSIADSISRMKNSSFTEYMSYIDSSIAEFTTCVEIYDGYYNAANNAGALYFTRKYDHYSAMPLFRKALSYKPDYVEALFNYGNCFEYELKGVKELQLIVGKNKLDSMDISSSVSIGKLYIEERKASFAMYMIKKDAFSILSAVNLNTPSWSTNANYKIMLSINTNLDVENGLLKSKIEVKSFEQQINKGVNGINPSNAQAQLQSVMSYIEKSLFHAIEDDMKRKVQGNLGYFNQVDADLTQIKNTLIDSAVYYWNKSLDIDPAYYSSYKALTTLYLNEGVYDKVKEINEKALSEGGFTDNMEFYLNIGNVFNFQKQYQLSVLYMEKAIAEVDKSYARIFNDETLGQNKKQASLFELIGRKKQIIGFVINISRDGGDFEVANQYQAILGQM